jgi:hypothetical protein
LQQKKPELKTGSSTAGRAVRRRLSAFQLAEFANIVEVGPNREVDVEFHERYVGTVLKKLGFSHLSARPRHPDLVPRRGGHRPEERSRATCAKRGTRPGQPADQCYESAYLFGAICPARGVGASLRRRCSSISMKSLAMLRRALAQCSCLTGRDGTPPLNSTCPRTSRRSPAFTRSRTQPARGRLESLCANWLSNRVFETYDAIVEAACEAWRMLIAHPETTRFIGMRDWGHVDQTS